jgi:NAD(P) transhydrogenase subunit alpha
MRLGIFREKQEKERRVALIPPDVAMLARMGWEVFVESGAGGPAGYPDSEYALRGATVVPVGSSDLANSDVVAHVEVPHQPVDIQRADAVVLGLCNPLANPQVAANYAATGASLFALELIPRTTRAQAMDVLSSMATIAGYRAVLLAAIELPRMFPLLMTAAGTLTPARVFVIGAGVAGLQAIATARRLGGVVRGYDVREAAAEQVESLGAKFVVLQMQTSDAEDQGGYARAQDEDYYRRQRELLGEVVAQSDVVITTAAIPGKPSPCLIDTRAVAAMPPGSVIVDLAAERGGNCELTQRDQRTVVHGVTILGPTRLEAEVPYHASQMFSRNITNFLKLLTVKKQLQLDLNDDIVAGTLVTHKGHVVHRRICELLGRPVPAP